MFSLHLAGTGHPHDRYNTVFGTGDFNRASEMSQPDVSLISNFLFQAFVRLTELM